MAERNPSVSVLLPVYNGGDFLFSAVETIRKQTYPYWELILIDDGSTDLAVREIQKFADPRIRVIQDGKRMGLAARLNQGIEISKGDYIARMDADDLAFPSRLEKQVLFLEQNPEVDLLSTQAVLFSENRILGLLPFREKHIEISRRPWRGMPMPHPTWMGRRQWFRQFQYLIPETILAEDQELLLRALPQSRYHGLPEVLLAYRQGKFSLKKRLKARQQLLKAQMRIFLTRREWFSFLAAIAVAGVKLVSDIVCSFCKGSAASLFWKPAAVPVEVIQQVKAIQRSSKQLKIIDN
jgi:glycosyltransferase involved in cell wall biosynthesis